MKSTTFDFLNSLIFSTSLFHCLNFLFFNRSKINPAFLTVKKIMKGVQICNLNKDRLHMKHNYLVLKVYTTCKNKNTGILACLYLVTFKKKSHHFYQTWYIISYIFYDKNPCVCFIIYVEVNIYKISERWWKEVVFRTV